MEVLLAPLGRAFEPVNDGVNAVLNPWLDEVEWVVPGAAPGVVAPPVNFFFFNGAVDILSFASKVGNDLYIYTAYTQPDNLGQELGGSIFTLTNLTTFQGLLWLGRVRISGSHTGCATSFSATHASSSQWTTRQRSGWRGAREHALASHLVSSLTLYRKHPRGC